MTTPFYNSSLYAFVPVCCPFFHKLSCLSNPHKHIFRWRPNSLERLLILLPLNPDTIHQSNKKPSSLNDDPTCVQLLLWLDAFLCLSTLRGMKMQREQAHFYEPVWGNRWTCRWTWTWTWSWHGLEQSTNCWTETFGVSLSFYVMIAKTF